MNFVTWHKAGLALTAALLILTTAGIAMAFGKTVTLFSEVHGRLIDASGAPQASRTITQSWRESPESAYQKTETVTDQDGRFHFSAVEKRQYLSALLPGTPAIKQRITVEGPTGLLTLWQYVKTSHKPLSETGGRPLDIICRIDTEENGDGPAWGTCQFSDQHD